MRCRGQDKRGEKGEGWAIRVEGEKASKFIGGAKERRTEQYPEVVAPEGVVLPHIVKSATLGQLQGVPIECTGSLQVTAPVNQVTIQHSIDIMAHGGDSLDKNDQKEWVPRGWLGRWGQRCRISLQAAHHRHCHLLTDHRPPVTWPVPPYSPCFPVQRTPSCPMWLTPAQHTPLG